MGMIARLASAAGILGALWIVGATIAGGAITPGYNHATQFISELGARGAPFANEMNLLGFLPAGVLTSLFALLAAVALPRSASAWLGFFGLFLFALGYLVAAFYTCQEDCRPASPDFEQTVHTAFGLAGYLGAPAFMVLLGLAARRWPSGATVSLVAFAAAATSFAALTMMLSPDFAYPGAAQRLLEVGVLSWILVCSFYLRRETGHAG